MTTATVDYMISLNTINEVIIDLKAFLDSYPRAVGTMVMVCDENENHVESMLAAMNSALSNLEDASDDDILSLGLDMSVDEFREWLKQARATHDYELSEVHRAREFLARYNSR